MNSKRVYYVREILKILLTFKTFYFDFTDATNETHQAIVDTTSDISNILGNKY